jgi:hypothetical protein
VSGAHTKGPWTVDFRPTQVSGVNVAWDIHHGGNCYSVAFGQSQEHCGPNGIHEAESRANAHLIAAAPDMLAAMADLLEAVDSMRNTFGRIEGRHPEEDDKHTHEKWAENFLQERADAARAAIAKAQGGAA